MGTGQDMTRTVQGLPALDRITLEILRMSMAMSCYTAILTAQDVHGRSQDNTRQTAGSIDVDSSAITAPHELFTRVAPYFKLLQDLFRTWAMRNHAPEQLGVPFLGDIYDQIRGIIISKINDSEGCVADQWTDGQYTPQTKIKEIADEIIKAMKDVEISQMTPSELRQTIWVTENVNLRKDSNRMVVTVSSPPDAIAVNMMLSDVPDAWKSWCVPVTLGLSDDCLRALKARCDAVISFEAVHELQLSSLLRDLNALKNEVEENMTIPSPAELEKRYDGVYTAFKRHLHNQGAVFPPHPDVTSGRCLPSVYGHESPPPDTAPSDDTQPRGGHDVVSPVSRSAIPRLAQQRDDDVMTDGNGESPSEDLPATQSTLDQEF